MTIEKGQHLGSNRERGKHPRRHDREKRKRPLNSDTGVSSWGDGVCGIVGLWVTRIGAEVVSSGMMFCAVTLPLRDCAAVKAFVFLFLIFFA